MNHTEEPWRVGQFRVTPFPKSGDSWPECLIDNGGNAFISVSLGGKGASSMAKDAIMANAHRLVACVNICAGVETDDLLRLQELGGLAAVITMIQKDESKQNP